MSLEHNGNDRDEAEWLECEYCGEKKEDVEETVDPYQEEINGVTYKCNLCSDCYHECSMEI